MSHKPILVGSVSDHSMFLYGHFSLVFLAVRLEQLTFLIPKGLPDSPSITTFTYKRKVTVERGESEFLEKTCCRVFLFLFF